MKLLLCRTFERTSSLLLSLVVTYPHLKKGSVPSGYSGFPLGRQTNSDSIGISYARPTWVLYTSITTEQCLSWNSSIIFCPSWEF